MRVFTKSTKFRRAFGCFMRALHAFGATAESLRLASAIALADVTGAFLLPPPWFKGLGFRGRIALLMRCTAPKILQWATLVPDAEICEFTHRAEGMAYIILN